MTIRAHDVCQRAGITYRQLDFWTRAGYVAPDLAVTGSTGHPTLTPTELAQLPERWRTPTAPGSGAVRYFSDQEADVIVRMATLIRIGLNVGCAARVGRSWAEHPDWPVYLGEGLVLRLGDWHPEDWHPFQAEYEAAYQAAHAGQGATDGRS